MFPKFSLEWVKGIPGQGRRRETPIKEITK